MEKAVLWTSALQISGKKRNPLESPFSVWTKPVYKTSWATLPAKQALTVGSSLDLMWSCYMIGVILIFQSICQKNKFAWCLHHVCLSLIHARIQANKLLIKSQPIRNLRTPASAEINKRGFYSRRPVPSLPNSSPFFPSSLSLLDACYAG